MPEILKNSKEAVAISSGQWGFLLGKLCSLGRENGVSVLIGVFEIPPRDALSDPH